MQRSNWGWFGFVFFSALVLIGAWFYSGWQSLQKVLPPGTTVAGLPMAGKTREQALEAIADIYAVPVTVYYEDEKILLPPEIVDLNINYEATQANFDKVLMAQSGWKGFLDYVRRTITRQQPQSQNVTVVLDYSRPLLDAFLERTAQKYNHKPQDPVYNPEVSDFRAPQRGRELDIAASRPVLVQALLSPTQREAHLVVRYTSDPNLSLKALDQALAYQLKDFPGLWNVYIKNLSNGQGLCDDCDVAFAGLAPLRLAAVLEMYRRLDAQPDPQTALLLRAALVESKPDAIDQVLALLGEGDLVAGGEAVTAFLRALGLQNSFITAPFSTPNAAAATVSTPANSRTDRSTTPPKGIQSTPAEIGILWEALYQCAADRGPLRLLFAQEISAAECQQVLADISSSSSSSPTLAAASVPVKAYHLFDWAAPHYAEVVIVEDKQTYLIVTYLYQPAWTSSEESKATFAEIGRLSYRFFNQ